MIFFNFLQKNKKYVIPENVLYFLEYIYMFYDDLFIGQLFILTIVEDYTIYRKLNQSFMLVKLLNEFHNILPIIKRFFYPDILTHGAMNVG